LRSRSLTPRSFSFAGIPVLLAVVSFTIYANFDLLRPFLDHVLDLVLR
jgi:hypothetical protein